jgi:hypothetical protein
LLRRHHQDPTLGARHERAIESGQALLADLVVQLLDPLDLALGAQLEGDQGLGASSHAMTDIVARHDQVFPLVIPPANNDMGMRMPGVKVVDGHPVELGIQIALHLGQQIADERLEVGKARSIVSRNDEAELVRVLRRSIQEGGAIDVIIGRVVEAARRTLAGHPVAHDVLEMRPRSAEVAGNDARVAGLDDHTAAARGNQPCGRAHAGTHSALGRGRRDVTSLPQRTGTTLSGLPEYESGIALSPGASRIPYASELGIELVLGHAAHLKAA